MLKENDYIFSRANMALDLLVIGAAVLVCHGLRNYIIAPYIAPEIFRFRSHLQDYWWLLVLLPVFSVIILRYNNFYKSQRVRPLRFSVVAILIATIGSSFLVTVVSFVFTPRNLGDNAVSQLFQGEFVSRGILLLFPFIATAMLTMKTVAVRMALFRLRYRGFNTRNVLVVGGFDRAVGFIEHLSRHPHWGFQVAGIVTNDSCQSGDSNCQVVGGYQDLFPYLEKNVIDDVVFMPGSDALDTFAPMLEGCEEMGIRTRFPATIFRNRISKPVLDDFDDMPVITFNPVREFGAGLMVKYAADRILAAVMLLILSPLMLIIAFLIKATSPDWRSPVLYGQNRCGLNGRQFTLWKFRSMVLDSEELRSDLESFNEMTGPVFKMKDDPRVTKVGKWLRKLSLDELPQFWNVLKGEMSLVGPRPPLPDEVQRYDRWQRRRLSMKPGITCIWQVSGRNKLSFETWMKLDLQYIDNWSLWLDIKILFKTLYVVATGYGAM